MGEFSYVQSEAQDWSDQVSFSYDAEPEGLPPNAPLLAAILYEKGTLTSQALQEALTRQALSGDSLAQVLIEGGWVAPDQMVEALQIRATYG